VRYADSPRVLVHLRGIRVICSTCGIACLSPCCVRLDQHRCKNMFPGDGWSSQRAADGLTSRVRRAGQTARCREQPDRANESLRGDKAGVRASPSLVRFGVGLSSTSLRYFNAAGATAQRGEQHDPETHLIPIVLEVAAVRRDLT
jgi:hypothetical protein